MKPFMHVVPEMTFIGHSRSSALCSFTIDGLDFLSETGKVGDTYF